LENVIVSRSQSVNMKMTGAESIPPNVKEDFKSAFPIEVDSDEDLMFKPKKRGRPARAA
jgi:hypothetical protein